MSGDERQTRIELINPAPYKRGWVDSPIREEGTPGGTNIIDGKPVKRRGRTDYLLLIPTRELDDAQECDPCDVLAELGYGMLPKSEMGRVGAFRYKNKQWLMEFSERTSKVLVYIANRFGKGGIEELDTNTLFDETGVVAGGGFDALAGLNREPDVLIHETKMRLLA